MSDIGDTYRAMRELAQADAAQSRQVAGDDFPLARDIAAVHGMELRRHSDQHYSLRSATWILNLYPGNGRVYSDPNKPGPLLRLQFDWTLVDAVKRAVQVIENGQVKSWTD